MHTRVKKDQFEIRDGVYIHRTYRGGVCPKPGQPVGLLVDSFVFNGAAGIPPPAR